MKSSRLVLDKVGADVEMFLLDAFGKPVPCINVIGGTKEEPRPILSGNGYAIQEDNVMPEYNIPPASDPYQFAYSLMRVQEAIAEEVKGYGFVPTVVPSMHFSPEQLEHKQARTAGCQPDFDVWEHRINDPVKLDSELRCAGAHVHVSFTIDGKKPAFPQDLSDFECLVMAFDMQLGIPSVILDQDRDRKKFYGKAGAFRYKAEYGGVEYRVLSNFWTKEPKLMAWVYGQVQRTFEVVNSYGANAHKTLTGMKDNLVKTINTGDVSTAQAIVNHYGIRMP